ncbi:uncharacterized protein IAS62_004422 [Cryptococcus decagattii]|uniref:Uncharacterized protein n=1 Tax=Cryptococcus decagattii TaxID=1859122 RepID=A0ABZ2AX10_9TREE
MMEGRRDGPAVEMHPIRRPANFLSENLNIEDDIQNNHGFHMKASRSYPTVLNVPLRFNTSGRQPSKIPHSRTLVYYFRRLTQLLSIIVGASSAVAALWSLLLLPLLHASFSARKSLVEGQIQPMGTLLEGVVGLQAKLFHFFSLRPDKGAEEESVEANLSTVTAIKEIESYTASTSSETDSDMPAAIFPFQGLRALSQSIHNLTTVLDATSTTRISLISTLESYTSHIHRQLFLAKSPGYTSNRFTVGLGTLSENLKMEGEHEEKGEEWDAVRKEAREQKQAGLEVMKLLQIV